MKHPIQSPSLLSVAACAVLLGTASAFAQAGSTPSSSSSSSTPSSSSSTKPSSSTSSTDSNRYGTGSSASGSYDSSSSATGTNNASTSSRSLSTDGLNTSSTMSSGKLSFTERRFVTKAADAGKEEVQFAQLGVQKATNPEVKQFAQTLIDEHTKVNSELTTLAGQKNVKLDQDEGRSIAYRRLSNKTGADFDQEFVEHMIDEHEDAVKMFEKTATDAKDADLRAFASKHVADLREHLQKAQSLRAATMPTGNDSTYSGRSDSLSTPTTGPMSSTTTSPGSSSSTSGTRTDSSTSSKPIGEKATGSDRSGDYTSPNPSASGSPSPSASGSTR